MQEADSINIDILPRTPAYTNSMMAEYCKSLMSVVEKRKSDPAVRKRIIDSYEYYSTTPDQPIGFKLRDYQDRIIDKGSRILMTYGFVYLAMEVRTGKTLTSLGIADTVCTFDRDHHVLFITKKKAISSIEDDYNLLKPYFKLTVVNYESLHHVMDKEKWDVIICDEAHCMGAFPKPSGRALAVKKLIAMVYPKVILLSGTPTPESYSQMYHQVYGICGNPFNKYPNFYRFCDDYVKVKQRKINGMISNDYSDGTIKIIEMMNPYTINYTQEQAGFSAITTETILEVELKEKTYDLIDRLKKDLVIQGKEELILADTPVKLMMKVHQLCSGTIKFESGNSMIVDTSKAEFIRDHFHDKKIGIFYKFKEELAALKQVFEDHLTSDLTEFEQTDKNIALQIVSGREGISLKDADCLVYYNIDFSATSYWQSKDRMTTKDRLENKVYWIFSKGGIEHDIYKAVIKKKDYTVSHFKKSI